MSIDANLVKELRDRTNAGIMDCKKALAESEGDLEKAIEWLRKKGIASATKKAGRVAAEGGVGVVSNDKKAVLFEINAETDFVSRNEHFKQLIEEIRTQALNYNGNLEDFKKLKCSNGKTIDEFFAEKIATIGENIVLRRMDMLEIGPDQIAGVYVHSQTSEGFGKIAALAVLKAKNKDANVVQFARQLAMHVAALKPKVIDIAGLDKEFIVAETAVLTNSGLDLKLAQKQIIEENVLLEQPFAVDNKKLADKIKEIGADIEVVAFKRFALGEGVEKSK